MDTLRADPPAALAGDAGRRRARTSPTPTSSATTCGGGARVQVRPSGTEPKVKLYGEAVGADPGPSARRRSPRLLTARR